MWKERKVALPDGRTPHSLIQIPSDALYYAAQGCVEIGRSEPETVGLYRGTQKLKWWIEEGQRAEEEGWKDQTVGQQAGSEGIRRGVRQDMQ